MSRRTHTAAVGDVPDLVVGFSLAAWPWPPRYVEVIATTLAAGHDVEFRFVRKDAQPWFLLHSYRNGALHVLGPDFEHLGTVASIPAALTRGWEAGGGAGAGLVTVPDGCAALASRT